MMRLKTGDKLEVMNKNDTPFTWRVAKILSANDHAYHVQHVQRDSYPCKEREQAVKVSRKPVKPNLPRLGKSYPETEDGIASNPSTLVYRHKTDDWTPQINTWAKKNHRDYYTKVQDDEASRPLKRMAPFGSSEIEAHNKRARKIRAIEDDDNKRKQKVHAVSFPREILGEKNMHASNSSDSDACSVGSCSVTFRSQNNFCTPFSCRDSDSVCSDAESCNGLGSERRKSSYFPLREEVEGSIRKLELHAYRKTLEALYACGPLSWEQEAMLTNLRIMLHISNDEHLMELKSLVSTKSKTAINFR